MRKRLLWLGVLLVLGAGIYVGSTRFSRSAQPLQLITAAVTRGDVTQTIDATGRLEAVATVQVGTQVSGTIKALYADFNSRVKRGQVVAELEPSLFETQVEQAQATVVRLEADEERARVQFDDTRVKLARAQELSKKQLVPATDVETAEANFRGAEAALKGAQAQIVQARASLNQAKVNLSHTIIQTPIDGVVISRNVDVGQTVAASMQAPTLFQIANDLTRMQVSTNIDEADIGHVAVGQAVTFQVDAFPNERFSGTVSQVRLNPVIASNVVSYVTIIEVSNPDLRLRPGMTATVSVEVAKAADTLRVPASAFRFVPTPDVFASLGQPAPNVPTDSAAAPSGNTPGSSPVAGRRGMPERLAQMTPQETEAFFAARGRGGAAPEGGPSVRTGGGPLAGSARPVAPSSMPRVGRERDGAARLWVLTDGRLQSVSVRTGITDGTNVAVTASELQDGTRVATGVVQPGQASAAAAGGSPLIPLPPFGRRGGGAGGAPRGAGPSQGGAAGRGP